MQETIVILNSLADDLEYELAQIAECARHASSAIRPLVAFQPDDFAL